MTRTQRITYLFGSITLWTLVLFGLVGVTLVVPIVSDSLAKQFTEYSNERWTIQALLSGPVILGIFLILEILLLLKLAKSNEMFSKSVFKWVRLLAGTGLALAASIAAIGIWLSYKNTLPPFVFLILVGSFLLVAAVSLVTMTLFGLLKRATSVTEELEGVI